MVVGFVFPDEDVDGGRKRNKYLVAHSSEQANSIFDYVHLSSALLRKVRFGQPIELAIQKPLKGFKASKARKKTVVPTNLEALSASSSDQQQQQQVLKQISSSRLLRQSSAAAISTSKALHTVHYRTSDFDFIRYGRVVRFQAADGGFLLVESDGCLRKVPSEHTSDPRTRITLFPCDPLASISKSHKRVRSGDWTFIVQGSAAALETELGIARADSDEMVEGPKYLVGEVARHNAVASARQQGESSLMMDQQQLHKHTHTQGHLSKQAIRKKQLAQAFPQETETMPPTVWCVVRVPKTTESHPSIDRLASHARQGGKSDDGEGCLPHGAQIQLFQNSFVVCYEVQSSKDDESNNDSSNSMKRVSVTPGSAASSSAHETTLSEGQPSNTSSLSLDSSSESSSSIFMHLWLQETPSFATAYHPTSCSCLSTSSNDRRKSAIWDNTWTICDIETDESRRSSLKNSPPVTSPLASREARRRSKLNSSAAEPVLGMDSRRLDSKTTDGDAEQGSLFEQEEEGDGDVSEDDEEEDPEGIAASASLQRQLSVFDVEKFAAKAETQQMRAVRIIVRFFRRVFRNEATHSRVQDFLRRRRRLTFTKKHVETHLSTREQLKLLQCYNPNVFGAAKAWPRQQHHHHNTNSVLFNTFTNRAEHDRQKLVSMKCDVAFLSRDWLRTDGRHSLSHRALPDPQSAQMYSRRPLSSPITPKKILANREREHHFHVEMKMAKRDPPNFHYGSFHAQTAMGQRPRTAPLANDLNGAKLP